MKIKSAEFVVSNTRVDKCPDSKLPEYAFIGRSNVGKSSLINMLTDRKTLAKTSAKPGKTQLINHFLINKNWHLVDLPGYGYAKVSKSTKRTFQKFITAYFDKRKQMICAFVLIDSRHEPQPIDMEFMQWLGEHQVPFCIIFTKADKLKPKMLEKNINHYQDKMLEIWEEMPEFFVSSATSKLGQDEILDYIEAINNELSSNNSPG
ncbi:ribosome biogenesis GTP-binding protein YihA/YsxC [Salegentibacter mishustinae]|uniref:Probable GTP-binding protein EngB n=1 Tax=Salegentibacter mishustinae TaxID=270918 RepID=A0A0Q9ZIA8_9FLAO|nr:ribosome biogenesis GTP-binding protein YihA/YsxC [Salegentibacter mishustinae]KRG28519.1 GTP-binding protein [Salegentibacter mishustinae]PNW22454.1 GTP-binding protein [Salegentibacter mishustinae]PZX67693.1 GTP-binding protein [Salegentibacter mishustinae]UBZ07545.1 ribosome biogenesis GTP-binding protein YihA/YsxC [Salegentibacter mishustinae]GGW77992.1 putative GTP-binding protein EngB [Salegentibacter mishustinae]